MVPGNLAYSETDAPVSMELKLINKVNVFFLCRVVNCHPSFSVHRHAMNQSECRLMQNRNQNPNQVILDIYINEIFIPDSITKI